MNSKEQVISIDYNTKVTAFYPYTSIVHDRFFEVEYDRGDQYSKLEYALIELAKKNGIEASVDNKIVFELTNADTGAKLYVGFKDWNFSIGGSVWTERPENVRRETGMEVLVCDECAIEHLVDPVSGKDFHGRKKFYFPQLPHEMCVCEGCYDKEEVPMYPCCDGEEIPF